MNPTDTTITGAKSRGGGQGVVRKSAYRADIQCYHDCYLTLSWPTVHLASVQQSSITGVSSCRSGC